MLIKKMWALLTLWTGALLVMSGCGMRSTVSHPDLVLDLVQMRLFGMVLGQPVPSECHRMIGDRSKYRPSLTLETESASSQVVCYDLLLNTNDTYGIFSGGYVMIERPSRKVIAIGGRFFSDRYLPVMSIDATSSFARGTKGRGNPWGSPGRPYREMLVDFFDVFAASRIELRSASWDSGNLHQTKFTVSDDLVVDLNSHQQFGEELIIHGANLSIVGECTLWNYKAARSGFLKGMVGRHPAEQLYDELRIREPRPNVRPDFGQTFR